ncbi:hypothetical protein OA168_02560 [Candidatus Pelagibacter sp.]|nr:hypothetical protein [Candidatus Pelagibacter sp.]
MFLTIKNIPSKSWSSEKPLNLKPKFTTFLLLCVGLSLFGFGEGLLLVSTTGNSPWSVLAEGLSNILNISIGLSTFIISIVVLGLWFPLKQKPGIGTILNILIIAGIIDLTLFLFDPPLTTFSKYILAVFSVLLVGLGSGIYLIANLGPGPRDGLMTGLTKKTQLPIALIRATLEISAVISGWYLGGTVGLGTIIFAFGIGPAVALGIYIVDKVTK